MSDAATEIGTMRLTSTEPIAASFAYVDKNWPTTLKGTRLRRIFRAKQLYPTGVWAFAAALAQND